MTSAGWGSYDHSKWAFAASVYRLGSQDAVLMQRQSSGGTSEFLIRINADGGLLFDATGAGGSATFRMNASTFTVNTWYNMYFIFDYLNGVSADRMKVYSNGVALTPDTYIAPTEAVQTVTSDTYLGQGRIAGSGFSGYIHQPAFISGNYPAAASIYNAANKFINLKNTANLFSLLNVPQGDIYEDYVLATDWTGTGSASTFTP